MVGPVFTYEIRFYATPSGELPFQEWRLSLTKDARIVVAKRLERLSYGLMGDCKSVGDGVLELRIHLGSGIRIYFAFDQQRIVLLLCGGSKRTQIKDIETAKKYLRDYKERA